MSTYDQKGRHRIIEEFGEEPDRIFAEVMGVRWMTKDESREAIPPVYTRHIGAYLRKELKGAL